VSSLTETAMTIDINVGGGWWRFLFTTDAPAEPTLTPEGTWYLSPVAGALAVGPSQGDGSWWSNSTADITTRSCLFDDQFVFNADGSFQNVQGSETWLETWQGVTAESCGAPVSPHDGSNAATWAYDETANTITITGEGAHLGLAKAINGDELDGTVAVPASVTYTVSSLTETAMTIDINVGGGWWRFLFTTDATQGLDDNVFNTVKMFPNPAKDTVQFSVNSNENLDIEIFDMLGKSVLRVNDVQNEVHISDLNSGLYFVQMTLGTQQATKKLIVN
jgi:hypothetical protein